MPINWDKIKEKINSLEPVKDAEFQVIDTKLHEGTPKEERARKAYITKNWKELERVPDNSIHNNADPGLIMEVLAEDIEPETVEPEGIALEPAPLEEIDLQGNGEPEPTPEEIEEALQAIRENRPDLWQSFELERAILGEHEQGMKFHVGAGFQFCDFNNGEPKTELWEMHLPDLSNPEAFQKQKEAYEMVTGQGKDLERKAIELTKDFIKGSIAETQGEAEFKLSPERKFFNESGLKNIPSWVKDIYNNPPGTEDNEETRAKRYFQERDGSE